MLGKQSFIKGAVILTAAGLTSRLIGAVFRIALAALITDEGIGLYQMAYPIYTGLLAVSTAGIPIAVSKLVSENIALNNYYGATRVFKVALTLLTISGFVISLAMYLGADFVVTYISRDPRAYIPLVAMAPAIFFVAIMSTFRGYFQGQQTMVPTGASQIIEQLTRVGIALFLAVYLLPMGLEYSAAGATFGAVAGAIFGLLFLVFLYFREKGYMAEKVKNQRVKERVSFGEVLYRIAQLAVPITIGSLILPLINILDLVIVPQRLHVAGFTTERATALYGQLTGMATPLAHIPAIITISLAVSLVPSISEALTLNNYSLIRRNSDLAIRLTLILGMPAAVGLYVLAEPVTQLLYNNVEAAIPLRIIAFSVIFLTLYQTTTGILQGLGKTVLPVKNMALGAFIKVIMGWTLTALPQVNIQGAALATLVGFAISSLLNLGRVRKDTGMKIDYSQYLIKPILAVSAMGLLVHLSYFYLNLFFNNLYAATLSNAAATLISIGAGMVVYGVMLFITGSITREDLQTIPKLGPYLIRLANALHIL
ncbi:MAG: polysaccharide biosynthesis protein, partial [Candidatus Syntrophonatronum acetioxidans]